MNDLKNLREAVTALHGCDCSHLQTTLVHEVMNGKTVWKGKVEVFQLKGHPKTQRAYAWSWGDDHGEIQYMAVLHVPPIDSPRRAVQAAILSKRQK